MKKNFAVENTLYTVEEITAIATSADEYAEDQRQNALLVTSYTDSGEKMQYVVFGFELPQDADDFSAMCDEPNAWDGSEDTLRTVR